jgi:hypothetical protein
VDVEKDWPEVGCLLGLGAALGLVSGLVSSGGTSGRKAATGLRMEVKMSLVRSMVDGSRDPGRVAKMVGRTVSLPPHAVVVEVAVAGCLSARLLEDVRGK